jgi:hypothetical protein
MSDCTCRLGYEGSSQDTASFESCGVQSTAVNTIVTIVLYFATEQY